MNKPDFNSVVYVFYLLIFFLLGASNKEKVKVEFSSIFSKFNDIPMEECILLLLLLFATIVFIVKVAIIFISLSK